MYYVEKLLENKLLIAFVIISSIVIYKLLELLFKKILDRVAEFLTDKIFNKMTSIKFIGLILYKKSLNKKYAVLNDGFFVTEPVSLSSIYIPMHLEIGHKPFKYRTPNEPLEPEIINCDEAIKSYDRLLLLGDPGAGKTTLLKRLAIDLINREIKLGEYFFPIYVELHKYSNKPTEDIEELLCNELKELKFKLTNISILKMREKGRLFVFFDGLDEVKEKHLNGLMKKIKTFVLANTSNKYIISCREQVYTKYMQLPQFSVAKLKEFDWNDIVRFIKRWPSYPIDKTSENLIKELENTPSVLKLCQNPLMLTILTYLYVGNKYFSIPDSVNDFLDDAISELFFRRESRSRTDSIPKRKKEKILKKFSLHLLIKFKSQLEFNQRDFINYCAKNCEDLGILKDQAENILIYYKNSVGIIRQIDRNGNMIFTHRLFQEYLAAKELKDISEKIQAIFKAYKNDRHTWFQVLIFYAALDIDIKDLKWVMNSLLNTNNISDLEVAAKIAGASYSVPKVIAQKLVKKLSERVSGAKD